MYYFRAKLLLSPSLSYHCCFFFLGYTFPLAALITVSTLWQIIYKSAMELAGVDAFDSIAVGDSLHHDIKGANASGIRSAFITGGIHATELGVNSFGEEAALSSVQALASKYDAYPSFVLPSFTW